MPVIAGDVVQALTRALADELPEIDGARLAAAVERAASSLDDREAWERLIHVQLDRVAEADAGQASAEILRDLADDLEHAIGDADRALTARLGAFADDASPVDLDPLVRLARATDRWKELPLDAMSAIARHGDDASRARWFAAIAAGWEKQGAAWRAADCHEWVLAIDPDNRDAATALERFYRANGEWASLIELLRRRAEIASPIDRAAIFRELGALYDRELGDAEAALDAYRLADRLEPDRGETLDAIARLAAQEDAHEDALAAHLRLAYVTTDAAPKARTLHRAAEIAWHGLHDADVAHDLLVRAREADADFPAAVDALVALRRERGELAGALELLLDAANRPALADDRARLLGDAAELCALLGETERAGELFRAVRELDPGDRRAAAALADLYWETGALELAAPILAELCASTHEPLRLHRTLIRLAAADSSRALAIDPSDPAPRRVLAELYFERGRWAEARPLIDLLLEHDEGELPHAACAELHYRAARCAFELKDREEARRHASIALALDPGHRASLLLRLELDADLPEALVEIQLALAQGAPPDEKAARYATLGDLYADRLGDPNSAREMYREALAYRPGDHILLTKSLGLVAGEGDWTYGLDLVQRLIDTEQDPSVRAGYRRLAAMILRDELARPADACDALALAVEDAPLDFAVADELEAMLAGDDTKLMRFYYRRLEQLRLGEGEVRAGESLRLWDRLGELCSKLGRNDDALCAYEVALTLDPDDLSRRLRLAELYVAAGADHRDDAIAQHQDILDRNLARSASYETLALLYAQTGRMHHARACTDALAVIGVRAVSPSAKASRPITDDGAFAIDDDGWWTLSGPAVDLELSALFALVAPVVAAERARVQPPPRRLPGAPLDDDGPIARVIRRVIGALGIARPTIHVDPDQAASCRVALRDRDGALAPLVVLGPAALDERALAFTLARRMADIRADRFARLLCPRAGDLAQLVELAQVLAAGSPAGDARGRAARWLASSLDPVACEQVVRIGARLTARKLDATRAALDWLEATERAADRVGLVVAGDLAACVRVLETEPAGASEPRDRILALVRASVRDDLLGVRARLEKWPASIDQAARNSRARADHSLSASSSR